MAEQDRATLKGYFNTGDTPTEAQFADLIDSAHNKAEDGSAVISDPSGVTGADAITNIISLTQAEYDAISSPDPATFYIITDAT